MAKNTHEDNSESANTPRYVWATGGIAGYDQGDATYGEMLDAGDGGILPGELLRDIVERYWQWRYDRAARPSWLEIERMLGVKTLDES